MVTARFQDILLKFHILEIEFLHEKIIFFGLDFFPDKVWLCRFDFWPLREQSIKMLRLAQPSSKFWKILWFSLSFKENLKIFPNLEDGWAYPAPAVSDICRVHFLTQPNHTLSGKQSRPKNIIFSWRNSIFKMWNLSRIS